MTLSRSTRLHYQRDAPVAHQRRRDQPLRQLAKCQALIKPGAGDPRQHQRLSPDPPAFGDCNDRAFTIMVGLKLRIVISKSLAVIASSISSTAGSDQRKAAAMPIANNARLRIARTLPPHRIASAGVQHVATTSPFAARFWTLIDRLAEYDNKR